MDPILVCDDTYFGGWKLVMSRIAESQAMRLFTQKLFDGEGLCEAHAETWRMAGWASFAWGWNG